MIIYNIIEEKAQQWEKILDQREIEGKISIKKIYSDELSNWFY